MKSSSLVISVVIVCVAVAGVLTYFSRQKTPPPAPATPPAASQTAEPAPPEKIVASKSEPPKTIPETTDKPAPVSIAAATSETKPDDSTNSIRKSVDALLSAKSGAEKHDLFQQLVKSGQIDAAIAELKQRMADNPNDPEIPTTLGEAQLNKLRALRDAGGDPNDVGILAMQADQSFNAALKIDPQNWEANFVKASSMYYWPADATRDNDVVQRLSGLIDQQETMPAQPQFVQTYVMLGNEYEKIGQPDKAMATWQLGLTKFPNDPTLLKKISGQ
jgi:tetratricopeptide (TPR) repeat protein